MNTGRRTSGYARLIAAAIGLDDAATLELVERMMRQETGGVLDHLSAAVLIQLARQGLADSREWDQIGPVNGITLADFCRAEQIDLPTWANSSTEASTAAAATGAEVEVKATRQIRVRRTFLVERVEEWVVDVPAAYDTDEWKANDLGGFDQFITDNGDKVLDDYEHVEFDDLELTVLQPTEVER